MATASFHQAASSSSGSRAGEPSTADIQGELQGFSPKGAIMFFALLILMYTLMWFSIYFELINRI